MQKRFKHTECMQVVCLKKKFYFLTKLQYLQLWHFRHLSTIWHECVWGSWVVINQGVGTEVGHEGIICVLQTQFSSFSLLYAICLLFYVTLCLFTPLYASLRHFTLLYAIVCYFTVIRYTRSGTGNFIVSSYRSSLPSFVFKTTLWKHL